MNFKEFQNQSRLYVIGALEAETRCADPTGLTVRQIYQSRPQVLDFCLESYDLATASPWGILDFSIEASANPRYIATRDFNGDGLTDLAVSNFGSDSWSIAVPCMVSNSACCTEVPAVLPMCRKQSWRP